MGTDEVVQRLEEERQICSLYIDSAKTFVQLSTGALVLSVTFATEFLEQSRPSLLRDRGLLITWLCWLLTVLFGVTYQYCVIKYLETIANDNHLLYYNRSWSSFIPKPLIDNPFWLYGCMLFLFYIGLMVFSIAALIRLL